MLKVYMEIVKVKLGIPRDLIDTVEDPQDMVTSSQHMLTDPQDISNAP
jgi:hypothetical protein